MQNKINKIMIGTAVIVTDGQLAQIEEMMPNDDWCDLKTAHNARRCGVLDAYVAWLGRFGNPPGFSQKSHPDGVLVATAIEGICK